MWTCCAAGHAQLVARLAGQLGDAGMVTEAEVLLQQLFAAVQAVKVRPGLLLCLWHSSAPNLADFCLICCTSTKWQQVPALTYEALCLQVRRTNVADPDVCLA